MARRALAVDQCPAGARNHGTVRHLAHRATSRDTRCRAESAQTVIRYTMCNTAGAPKQSSAKVAPCDPQQ